MKSNIPQSYVIGVENLSNNPHHSNLMSYLKRVVLKGDELNIIDLQNISQNESSISGEWLQICEKEKWNCRFHRIVKEEIELISKNMCLLSIKQNSKNIIYNQTKKKWINKYLNGSIPTNLINKCKNKNIIIIKED